MTASSTTESNGGGSEKHDIEKGVESLKVETAGSAITEETKEPRMTFRRFMSLVAMGFLWVGSQIPVYLFGGIPPHIYSDIGGEDRWIWFIVANLLALAAICPFVGNLSDLMGRRHVSLLGAVFQIIGMIICSTAKTMNVFIGGMVFSGVGAGINELTALAVTAEIAPTRKRGTYVAILIFTVIPFVPSILWGQLIAVNHGWRWIGLFCGLWAVLGFIFTFFFYHPPPRANSVGLSKMDVLKRIDYVGGLLSTSGMVLFMGGLQWAGYQYGWRTAHVLVPLILGGVLIIAFCVWEVYGAPYPMFPSRLKQAPRVLILTLIITFISGANFFSVLMFWPVQAYNMYDHDPIQLGIRGLPVGFGILGGAVICLLLLSVFRGGNRELMIVSSMMMTAGCGGLAIAGPNNLNQVYGLLFLASFGIGGIVVPASIITTIICPSDLIATVAALTLAIRVVGGSIGYTIYFNIFIQKFEKNAIDLIGTAMLKAGVWDTEVIKEAILLTASSLLDNIKDLPGIDGDLDKWNSIVVAGKLAYAESYKWVYIGSIPFGVVSVIAAFFLGDIEEFMDDKVAVVIE